MQALNWVDYVILTIFLLSALSGLGRGLIKEVISLISLVTAFIVAAMFANPVASSFISSNKAQEAIEQTTAAVGVSTAQPASYAAIGLSFACIFAVTVLLGALIGMIINLAFQAGGGGFGNRLLGGVFGCCRAFIMCLVIIFIVQLTSFSQDDFWKNSQLIRYFQPSVIWLGNVVSPTLADLRERMENGVQDANTSISNIAIPSLPTPAAPQ